MKFQIEVCLECDVEIKYVGHFVKMHLLFFQVLALLGVDVRIASHQTQQVLCVVKFYCNTFLLKYKEPSSS